jgi:hypothetical protein
VTSDISYCRIEYHTIADKTFVVIAEEKKNATDTPLDIIRRLIYNRSDKTQQTQRTRCLPFNRGK